MNESAAQVEIALRIPGQWAGPKELIERLPPGCRLTAEKLILPDETVFDFGAMDADDQFADIFRSSCRQPATDEEFATVDNYTVNICLSGPGGSKESAHAMMKAAQVILDAGGAGVFIDNCGLAHGATLWRQMTDDGSPDALSFAFVGIVSSPTQVYTMGLHVLGQRDVLMKRAEADEGEFDIIEMIRYLAGGEKPIEDGHILADLNGPRFQAFVEEAPQELANSPMHNPFGRLKLVSARDIAEKN